MNLVNTNAEYNPACPQETSFGDLFNNLPILIHYPGKSEICSYEKSFIRYARNHIIKNKEKEERKSEEINILVKGVN